VSENQQPATVTSSLVETSGLSEEEREGLPERWQALDARLRSFPAEAVRLDLTVKERSTPAQRTTLECSIARRPRLVATSSAADIGDALAEVRDDLIRQISDAKNRTEPRNNRKLRTEVPPPR
jgi:ribosome-associated translation inhibitor RaiA